ncbi:MAG: ATP-binding cassette domain-containing protein [Myxococcota bacterium]|nr:ATP-binding cassette domain-containing protein [Myxococcota bacterium]
MTLSSPLRILLPLASRQDRARLAAIVLLGTIERIAVVAAAFGFARDALLSTVLATAAALAVLVTRRAFAAITLRSVRAGVASAIVQCLLASESPSAAPCEEDDTLSTAVAGLQDAPQFLAGQVPALGADSMAALAIAPIVAFQLPSRVLLVAVLAITCASAVVGGALRLTTRWSATAQRAFSVVYDDLAAAIGGRLEIIASGRAGRFHKDVAGHLAFWQREQARASFRIALATRLPLLAAAAAAGLAIWIDGTARGLFARQALGQGLVVASIAPMFIGVLRGCFEWVRSTQTLRPLLVMLAGDEQTVVRPTRSSAVLSGLPRRIEWSGISFAYRSGGSESRFVLRHLTGIWTPQTAIAISGPNGSGKSTFLRLILGIGTPQSGRILVGGTDLLGLDIEAWRRSVAYLPQRPFIPERATVRDAVHFIVEGAPDSRIRDALARVDLWPALANHTSDDPLGVRVLTLSAGQRQRLALARVLCQNARIVLLDEPDANLDAAGVQCVIRIVREIATGGMVAFAAHTRELLDAADGVVPLYAPTPRAY